jgi:hypothetical protein
MKNQQNGLRGKEMSIFTIDEENDMEYTYDGESM